MPTSLKRTSVSFLQTRRNIVHSKQTIQSHQGGWQASFVTFGNLSLCCRTKSTQEIYTFLTVQKVKVEVYSPVSSAGSAVLTSHCYPGHRTLFIHKAPQPPPPGSIKPGSQKFWLAWLMTHTRDVIQGMKRDRKAKLNWAQYLSLSLP